MAQAGIVPANGGVAGYAGHPQALRHFAELWQEKLKDEREPDNQRLARSEPRRDFLTSKPYIDQFDRTALPLQDGRQVAHPEIALILIANERNLGAGLNRCGNNGGVFEDLAPLAVIHGS
ncbi:hypothetical protein GCM10007874_33460 [Labrys miyagiensis]|uniref:Uncharacterized protein n=1 Tax=Labrys miyagiensis TaxID=346912 RepID=A0ABQ6CKQ4_9HYPH|nr:hypothetical protein GCM10007874_33460 [Labrys miyagiensis]